MIKGKRVICIIPARGGSKGLPRKNIRFLNGKPLISYSIENALASKYIDEVNVSTDDKEIAYYSRVYGACVIDRPSKLAGDDVTLEPVIIHGWKNLSGPDAFQIIVTLQPTSPTLKPASLDSAIERFISGDAETLLSAVDDTHLSWGRSKGDEFHPLYEKRLNRQQLPSTYRETGGFVITSGETLEKFNGRFGDRVDLFILSKDEAIDIDSSTDWSAAVHILGKKKILINTIGHRKSGLGHIYRGIILADEFTDHHVIFSIPEGHIQGIEKLKGTNYSLETFKGKPGLEKLLKKQCPDITINDTLDTTVAHMRLLKKYSKSVITFEDLGAGAEEADMIFNALYEKRHPSSKHFWGSRYYLLRNDLRVLRPHPFPEKIENILVTFGGVDENDLTLKTLDALLESGFTGSINVVLGLGYKGQKKLHTRFYGLSNIEIHRDVPNMGEYISSADIGITSAGRTVYEFSSLRIPTIVMAQNQRELSHRFASNKNGIYFLGLGRDVSKARIAKAAMRLVNAGGFRKRMYDRLCAFDLTSGAARVVHQILAGYEG